MMGGNPAFTFVLALAVGVVAQSLARHLRVPGIVVLLLAGASLGPDGLGWVEPRSLGEGLIKIVDLAVAVILFEGGLNLDIRRLRREQSAIQRLVTLGAVVTLVGGALAVHFGFGWSWTRSLLFGSLVVVTGPTVVGPLLQELRLRQRVATVLEAEGVLIDPIGAVLAVLMLEVALAPGSDSLTAGAGVFVLRLGFGAALGVAAGFALAAVLRARRIVPEGYANITVLASVLLIFEGCDAVVSHSGILAVTIAGVVVGNLRSSIDRDLREFKDQLSVMLIGLLFVLLAADVRLEDVRALGWPGVGIVAALILFVRPINVWVSTIGSELTFRERLLVAWIAPRGIVAAAVASVASAGLDGAGLPGGPEMRALVFLTIAVTVVLAGLTSLPLANLLHLRLPGRDRVAILGAQGLGLALARQLEEGGSPVVFLDANPQNCRRAQEAGFQVVYGDALQERTMLRTRPESVGSVIGLTPNQMLNSVFVSRCRDRFRVPRGYVAAARPDAGLAPEVMEAADVALLFEGPHDVERWDVRSRHDSVEVEQWSYRGEPPAKEDADAEVDGEKPVELDRNRPTPGERLVMLAVRRASKVSPMSSELQLKAGDVVAVAVYTEEREAAHDTLRALGFEQAD